MEPKPFFKAPSMSSLVASNMMSNLRKLGGTLNPRKVAIASGTKDEQDDSPSRRERFQSSQSYAASKSHHHIGVQKRRNSNSAHNDLRTIKNKVNRALRQFVVNIDHEENPPPNSETLRNLASSFIKTTESQI
jgi:hypothetical protein